MFTHKNAFAKPVAQLMVAASISLSCAQTWAQQMDVTLSLPRLKVAEYHRPYVAVWVEQPGAGKVTNLSVWYDRELADREGEKWLKDMRQWWRRSGRSLSMPVDGVSGATRAPGEHKLHFVMGEAPLGTLAEGDYRLMVEAAREVGGREVVTIPFSWPPAQQQILEQKGEHELGRVALRLSPTSDQSE